MEEFGQGGRSRLETADSASTRWSARASGTCSSPSTPTRERIRSSASSTEITAVLYPAPPPRRARERPLAGLAEERLVPGQEAPAAQDEEREEAGGDEDLTDPQREGDVLVDGREDDHDAFDEDRDPAHEEDHREDLVTRGWASRQPLQKVREG